MAEIRLLRHPALAAALALAALVVACSSGGGGSTPDEAATSTAEATPTPAESPTATSAQQATIAFVENEGLDGETHPFADEINCRAYPITDEPPDELVGSACIDFILSHFEKDNGSMAVRILGEEGVWDVTLELQDVAWVATGASFRE
jgi:hypothetical protein